MSLGSKSDRASEPPTRIMTLYPFSCVLHRIKSGVIEMLVLLKQDELRPTVMWELRCPPNLFLGAIMESMVVLNDAMSKPESITSAIVNCVLLRNVGLAMYLFMAVKSLSVRSV
ncbi:hypothetical protein PPS11_02768 [Pseudomonas putida S11]|nr:hypothetical protein PPS11_02768 [Pseudomonas putida S11]